MQIKDIKELLSQDESIDFIKAGLSANISELIFQYTKDQNKLFLVEQIAARQKIKKKLPSFYSNPLLCLPKKLNLEQSSAEAVAKWRSKQFCGNKMIDLSGGLGIDFICHSKEFKQATYVELNEELANIAIYNFSILKLNFQAVIKDSNKLEMDDDYDLIFLDPDRRNKETKLIKLTDCSPNLIDIQEDLLNRSNLIVSKLSPMISLQSIIQDLINLSEIWVISYRNECKEVLSIQSSNQATEQLKIRCINIESEGPVQDYSTLYNSSAPEIASTEVPLNYIYIPNTSLIKANLSDQYATELGLLQLGQARNLYSSESYISNFNGRILKLIKSSSGLSKDLKKSKYNVISRYPKLKASDIENKLNLKPSDNMYLIAFPNSKGKLSVLIAELQKAEY